MTTVPGTSRTTRKVNVVKSIPGMICTGSTTEYEATSTRPNISITHEKARSKYDATENHTETPSTQPNISVAHEFSRMGSNIGMCPTYRNRGKFHQRDQKFQLHMKKQVRHHWNFHQRDQLFQLHMNRNTR
jgi:hypothetical protein